MRHRILCDMCGAEATAFLSSSETYADYLGNVHRLKGNPAFGSFCGFRCQPCAKGTLEAHEALGVKCRVSFVSPAVEVAR